MGKCPKCESVFVMLIDTGDSDWTEHNELCARCIKKHGDQLYRESQRAKRRQSDLGNSNNITYEQFNK